MMKNLSAFIRSEEGQAVSEYGMVIAAVAVGLMGGMYAFRDQIKLLFAAIVKNFQLETDGITVQ